MPLFEVWEHRPKRPCTHRPKRRILARQTIRNCYVYVMKRRFRTQVFDAQEEAARGYARLMSAYRTAYRKGNAVAMVLAQRQISQMLGLRAEPSTGEVSGSEETDRLVEMFNSVPTS